MKDFRTHELLGVETSIISIPRLQLTVSISDTCDQSSRQKTQANKSLQAVTSKSQIASTRDRPIAARSLFRTPMPACRRCNGSGRVSKPCPYCDSTGRIRKSSKCKQCPAAGELDCGECRGRGRSIRMSTCENCSGTGSGLRLSCGDCGGTGRSR